LNLPAGSTAVISIAVSADTPGPLTNFTAISRLEADASLENNIRTTVTEVIPATGVWIDDTSVTEGDSGTTNATFDLHLSAPVPFPVTVSYSTVADSALDEEDFTPVEG